jgi:hypothetical protein
MLRILNIFFPAFLRLLFLTLIKFISFDADSFDGFDKLTTGKLRTGFRE